MGGTVNNLINQLIPSLVKVMSEEGEVVTDQYKIYFRSVPLTVKERWGAKITAVLKNSFFTFCGFTRDRKAKHVRRTCPDYHVVGFDRLFSYLQSNRNKIIELIETVGKDNINKYFDLIAGKTSVQMSTTVNELLLNFTDKLVVSPEAHGILQKIISHLNAWGEVIDSEAVQY